MMLFGRRSQRERMTIVGAAEAYLNGSYASYVARSGQLVPSWGWLNRCAHGDLATLRAIPEAQLAAAGRARSTWSWARAEHVLAQELLAIVEDDEDLLLRIQEQVLIPLEMTLIERSTSERLTAPTLVSSVRAALRSSLS